MATLLDDLDPYGAQSHAADAHDRKQSWRESTPDDAPASPITRLLDLSFLAAVTPRSPERSALIDFSVSPPPPLYPSSKPSAQPDMAPVHLLDNDSFAIESPIRSSEAGWQAEEKENRPLAKPARKRWSVMTKLREEQEQRQDRPRQSSPPVKDLSPFRAAGDASVFPSPSQLGVVDLSLIADEGASFLAVADTSETAALPRLGSRAPQAQAQTRKDENLSGDSSGGGGQSGGMSVLLRGFEGDASAITRAGETGRGDPAHLAQSSSILPTTLTSSHRRALQQSVAHFDSPPLLLNEATFSFNDPSSSRGGGGGEEVTLLNCSTASFKDYRDSPRKPRLLLSTHTEDWSLEEEEGETMSSQVGDDGGKTPRPPRRQTGRGRVSDATTASFSSDGDSFRLDRFQTSGFGTGILNQSPPTAALKPESTGTLRLELGLGLGGLDAFTFASPPREASVSPPGSPVTSELASSTRTVTAPSRSSSRASTVVDDALARSSSSETETELETETTRKPPRVPVVVQSITATPMPAAKATAMSGAERLKRRLEELRAQKQRQQAVSSSTAAAAASTRTRASTTTPAATIVPTSATPAAAAGRSFARPSLEPTTAPPTTTGRLARPRTSALPPTTAPPMQPPATPGERKESTAARLERLRSERKERETIRSATTATPGRTGGGLVRSASLIAPRDRSLASFSSGGSSDVRSGSGARFLPSSQSLADLSTIAKQPATASRRTSLLPAPAPAPTAPSRRTSLAPSSEVPRRRMSLAPESSSAPPPPAARSSRQSLAPTSRDNGLDRSLPPSSSFSSSSSRTSVASSIRRSSSLQQISEPVPGRRGSLAAAAMKPNLASLAPTQERTPFKSLQAQSTSSELAAMREAASTTSGIARAPSTRRLSRLARPSMGSLGPR
ncbi:hypothetical protein C6P46_006786 [Rhodotorula mucilaginosa]|uniref:Proteophosphoglycan ppg4 n=1 Tax=Rhodotorula mucilaginosa TaxID=5537 RepID=A0A9P6W7V9_RHOMI|nr:hypothetical protein C6P46_006786 [Rhodotorula mucilaginosa]